MSCCSNVTNTCSNPCGHKQGNGFLLVFVLYILLAIIVGSFIC